MGMLMLRTIRTISKKCMHLLLVLIQQSLSEGNGDHLRMYSIMELNLYNQEFGVVNQGTLQMKHFLLLMDL